jgi:DNA-3-methyladenine glycosylase
LKVLPLSFYQRTDVVQVAKELLGKVLVTRIDNKITSGRIAETEAYVSFIDKASHAYKGRRTQRNEHMYAEAGTSYVYICYGMHQMFNVVTNEQNIPDAVLIRALEPLKGIDTMLKRTGKTKLDNTLTRGPGNLCRAMGISKIHSGLLLHNKDLFLAEDDFELPPSLIGVSKRIGIDGAGEDALLPYRFYIKGNPFVSGRPAK